MRKSERGKVWIHFRRKNKRYITPEGTEITVAELMDHPHEIMHDDGRMLVPRWHPLATGAERATEGDTHD